MLARLLGIASAGVPVQQLNTAVAPVLETNVTSLSAARVCETITNERALNFKSFCTNDKCWPALYILGVQKAATTSVAESLETCGLTAFGLPTRSTVHFSAQCTALGHACKETLHPPLDTLIQNDKKAFGRDFTSLYDLNSCGSGVHGDPAGPGGVSHEACKKAQFLEATPDMGIKDGTLFAAIPHHLRTKARFVVILREPVSRMLSWYNHVSADPVPSAGAAASMSSFEAFAKEQWEEHLNKASPMNAYGRGLYFETISHFHSHQSGLSRKQLLVLNFDQLIDDPALAFRQITRHYGLPILTHHNNLPKDNTHDGPQKVVSIKCETRTFAEGKYASDLKKLYTQLAKDLESSAAPHVQEHFAEFDVKKAVQCTNGRELTLGPVQKDPSLTDELGHPFAIAP
jgi:hypothetical protein